MEPKMVVCLLNCVSVTQGREWDRHECCKSYLFISGLTYVYIKYDTKEG